MDGTLVVCVSERGGLLGAPHVYLAGYRRGLQEGLLAVRKGLAAGKGGLWFLPAKLTEVLFAALAGPAIDGVDITFDPPARLAGGPAVVVDFDRLEVFLSEGDRRLAAWSFSEFERLSDAAVREAAGVPEKL